ncbi:MAG: hypothetical protein WD766_04245 [Gemmatimonadota bacterium]
MPASSRSYDEDGQVAFKGKAERFLRAYAFLSSLPYTNAEWEKLSVFLTFLVSPPAGTRRRGPQGVSSPALGPGFRRYERGAGHLEVGRGGAEYQSPPFPDLVRPVWVLVLQGSRPGS